MANYVNISSINLINFFSVRHSNQPFSSPNTLNARSAITNYKKATSLGTVTT